jgi:hypothetical protein
MDQDILKAEQN